MLYISEPSPVCTPLLELNWETLRVYCIRPFKFWLLDSVGNRRVPGPNPKTYEWILLQGKMEDYS